MRETLNQRGEPARSLLAIPQDAMTSMRGQSGGPPPGTEQNRRRQHVPESGATALFVITWRAHRSKANGDTWSGRRRTRQTFLFFLLLMSRTHACTTLTAIYKLSSGDKSRQAELEQRSFTGNHTHLQKKKSACSTQHISLFRPCMMKMKTMRARPAWIYSVTDAASNPQQEKKINLTWSHWRLPTHKNFNATPK